MGNQLMKVERFKEISVSKLKEVNTSFATTFHKGNITYAIEEVEFSVPIREKTEEGEKNAFVVLGKDVLEGDKITKIDFRAHTTFLKGKRS